MATNDNDVIMMLYCQTFMCNKSLVQNIKNVCLFPVNRRFNQFLHFKYVCRYN